MTRTPHHDVASYVLGVLDEDDNEAFEIHLTKCLACQNELRQLYDLPDLLDEAKGPQPPGRELIALMDEVADRRRRRNARFQLMAAAAAVIVLTAPVTAWIMSHRAPAPKRAPVATVTQVPHNAETLYATTRENRIKAKIRMVPERWGTQVLLELAGVHGPLECELVVESTSGEKTVVTTWNIPGPDRIYDGINPPPAGTALPRDKIAGFEIRTTSGDELIEVPAERP